MKIDDSELIDGYFDGELDLAQTERLADWIKASPENAQCFASAALLHDRLQHEIANNALASRPSKSNLQTPPNKPDTVPPPHKSRSGIWLALIASLLLCLTLATSWSRLSTQQMAQPTDHQQAPSADNTLATVTRLIDVKWSSNSMAALGSQLPAGQLNFSAGIVGLRFNSGVEVTLQGPAKYELLNSDQTLLHCGVLSAVVPPGAEGFGVQTTAATVTDLGTAFGMQVSEAGDTEVAVFDGEVDIALHDAAEQYQLQEGDAVRIQSNATLKPVEFSSQPFEKLWPVWSGITGSSGAFEFKPPWPRRLRLIRNDSKILIVPDRFQRTLDQPLPINIDQPGTYRLVSELNSAVIPADKPLRSFLLHYHPETTGTGTLARIEGSITFDREVLGIAVLQNELAAWKSTLSPDRSPAIKSQRQLELNGRLSGDQVTLSEDRRTVAVSLGVRGRFSDMIRVVVDDYPLPSASLGAKAGGK